MAFVLGVDPGRSGGLAVIGPDGLVWGTSNMPAGDGELATWLAAAKKHATTEGERLVAYLEDVWCSPQMGVKSAFTFGQEVGRIKMALRGTGIPYELVVPVRWQNALGCRTFGDKNVTRAHAAHLFPVTKVTHAIADALLIAEFGVRLQRGTVPPLPVRLAGRR